MSVSDNKEFPHYYQHFYTGAFMSEGYPANKRGSYGGYIYDVAFGGLPSNTYTTVTLHSSPSLLLGKTVELWKFDGLHLPQFSGFSTELQTPISIFTEEGYAVVAHYSDPDTLFPALLFSFKGL